MKISHAEAIKYAEILEILADPYALMICDHLFETDKYATVDELVELTKSTRSNVEDICYKLEKKSVLDKDYVNGENMYKPQSGSLSYFVKMMLNIFD